MLLLIPTKNLLHRATLSQSANTSLSLPPHPAPVVPVSLHELIPQLGNPPGGPRSGYGEFCESRVPFPTPTTLAHPDTVSLSAKNQLKQPESLSERRALYA